MRLLRKPRTFLALSGADRWCLCEAMLLLGLARSAVLIFPFRFIAGWLSRTHETSNCDEAMVLQVSWAVRNAARNVPWKSLCLVQAMAAKAMLARRGCGSACHIGATFDPNGKVIGHAWLSVGGKVILGGEESAGMSPLVRFG